MMNGWDQKEAAALLEEMRKHGCIPSYIRDEVDHLVENGAIFDALRLILDPK